MQINVIHHGLQTTIQDLGRPGYYHLGIPMGGAMDRLSLRAANLLVGNAEDAACLEAVFMGPTLAFTHATTIAITGAELPPLLDGKPCKTWTTLQVKEGQTLSFGTLGEGARAYIAVAGGIDTPLALGSRSTYAIGALGGVDGRPIQAGDKLPVGTQGKTVPPGKFITPPKRAKQGEITEIRVIKGLYAHRVTPASIQQFFTDSWQVASEADRMGYRFQGGKAIEFIEREPPFGAGSDPSNITDACYPYGSIQIPNGSEPIILHRDAVSGGGYFMIGTVISADMDLIGQLQPHAKTRFIEVDMPTALAARQQRNAHIQEMRASLMNN